MLPEIYSKEMKICLHKDLHMDVHSSLIGNTETPETIQMFTKEN